MIASDLEPLDKVVRALRAPDRTLYFVCVPDNTDEAMRDLVQARADAVTGASRRRIG